MNQTKLVVGITAPQSVVLLKGQLKFFSKQGYEVFLLAPKTKQTQEFCKFEKATLIPVSIKRKIKPFSDVVSFLRILFVLNTLKPDIVNFGTPKISLLGLLAAKIIGVNKRYYTCRGFRFEHESGLFRKFLIFLEKVTSFCAHKVICISSSVRDLGIKEKVFKEHKSLIIHKGSSNGLNLGLFNPSALSPNKMEELKLKHDIEDRFTFGYLGRIINRKGFVELVSAFDEFYSLNSNVQLLIVGRPDFDQLDDNAFKKAKEHKAIIMTGLVPYEYTPYYFRLMDIFILPAYWEGFGNVLIQAAAMGIPIISTEVTGCKDAVSKDYNGLLIKERDPEALFSAMVELFNNPLLQEEFSKNGIEWAGNFKSELIWNGLLNLYKMKCFESTN